MCLHIVEPSKFYCNCSGEMKDIAIYKSKHIINNDSSDVDR